MHTRRSFSRDTHTHTPMADLLEKVAELVNTSARLRDVFLSFQENFLITQQVRASQLQELAQEAAAKL